MNRLVTAGVAVTALLLGGVGCTAVFHGPAVSHTNVAGTSSAPSPSSSATPVPDVATGTYPINKVFYDASGLELTLTTIMVASDGQATATVTYTNLSATPAALECAGVTDPSIDSLALAGGTVHYAAHSYCSDNPDSNLDLPAHGTHTSYATFSDVSGSAGPFTFTWQEGSNISGNITDIVL